MSARDDQRQMRLQIEKRIEQLEDRTRQTDEHAKRTEDLLQQKMAELSKLQAARNFHRQKVSEITI